MAPRFVADLVRSSVAVYMHSFGEPSVRIHTPYLYLLHLEFTRLQALGSDATVRTCVVRWALHAEMEERANVPDRGLCKGAIWKGSVDTEW